jgi:hypothetical protein
MGRLPLLALLLATWITTACSIKRVAINKIGNALASGGTTFTSDEDPELVRDALPFSLKLIESHCWPSPRIGACFRGRRFLTLRLRREADELEDRTLKAGAPHPRAALSSGARLRTPGAGGCYPTFGADLRRDQSAARACGGFPLLY